MAFPRTSGEETRLGAERLDVSFLTARLLLKPCLQNTRGIHGRFEELWIEMLLFHEVLQMLHDRFQIEITENQILGGSVA